MFIKGTLMQIWKSFDMPVYIKKQYLENLAFDNPKKFQIVCPWNL